MICRGCRIKVGDDQAFCPWGCREWAEAKGDAKVYRRLCAESRLTWQERTTERPTQTLRPAELTR